MEKDNNIQVKNTENEKVLSCLSNCGCLISQNSLPQRTQRIFTKDTKRCYATHYICVLCVNLVLFVVKKTYGTAPSTKIQTLSGQICGTLSHILTWNHYIETLKADNEQ